MCNNIKIFIWISIFTAVSCSEKSTNFIDTHHYPFEKTSLLEYNSVLFIQFYDSTGNLNVPTDSFSVNSIVQLLSDTASIGSYTNLYLLKSFEVDEPNRMFKSWYHDSDAGLYTVAYSTTGIVAGVLPKQQTNILPELLSDKLKKLNMSYFVLNNFENTEDSIYVLDEPRKILSYPLFSGSRWFEIIDPIQIERMVTDKKTIDVSAGTFTCYKISRVLKDPAFRNLSMFDYIDLNIGLVKRELVSDSMITVNEFGDTTGFFKFSTISELVRKE